MERQQPDARLVDRDVEIVDHVVAFDDLAGERRIARDERGDGVADLFFHEPAHFQDFGPQMLQFLFVLTVGVEWHGVPPVLGRP